MKKSQYMYLLSRCVFTILTCDFGNSLIRQQPNWNLESKIYGWCGSTWKHCIQEISMTSDNAHEIDGCPNELQKSRHPLTIWQFSSTFSRVGTAWRISQRVFIVSLGVFLPFCAKKPHGDVHVLHKYIDIYKYTYFSLFVFWRWMWATKSLKAGVEFLASLLRITVLIATSFPRQKCGQSGLWFVLSDFFETMQGPEGAGEYRPRAPPFDSELLNHMQPYGVRPSDTYINLPDDTL